MSKPDLRDILAENIRAYRLRAGLSQDEFADQCGIHRTYVGSPTDYPQVGKLLPLAIVFRRLRTLVGSTFPDLGRDQERNRGAGLHRLVCKALGYHAYADDGRFPDLKHQLIEVKLQTSPTIDLGLVTPDSVEPLDIPMVGKTQIRHWVKD